MNEAIAEITRLRSELDKCEEECKKMSLAHSTEIEELMANIETMRNERVELCALLRLTRQNNEVLRERLVKSEELRAEMRRRASTRSPTERVLRRAFAEKVEQLALTHARTTARMLNVQKRCFEEELESLEGEAHATVVAFERQFAKLREDSVAKDEEHAREREAAFAKTAAVMAAVKRRIECADKALDMAKRGRKRAESAAKERHEALVKAVRERTLVTEEIGRISKEVSRKNAVIDRLQQQLDAAIKELGRARSRYSEMEKENLKHQQNQLTPKRAFGGAPTMDVGKLSKLFASVIADYTAGAQADGVVVVDESPIVSGTTPQIPNATSST